MAADRVGKLVNLSENLHCEPVGRLPLRPALAVTPETSIADAVQAMRDAKVGYCLISRDGGLLGIFTDRDLIARVLVRRVDSNSPIGEFMTPDPITVGPNDSIAKAMQVMCEGHLRHLPVVDEGNVPLGVASVKHIVAYLVDHYPSTVYNLPPRPGQVQTAREGP